MNPRRIVTLFLLTLTCGSVQQEKTHRVSECEPQNVSLSRSGQTLLLTWDDAISCSSLRDVLVYELEVLIAERTVHYDQVSVTAGRRARLRSWSWTSPLPFECASHSVRLRSRVNNQPGPWKRRQIVPGTQDLGRRRVFPRDRLFQAGSRATFCCVVPEGHSFDQMYLSGYRGAEINTSRISGGSYSLTLLLEQPSEVCVDIKCKTNVTSYGACVYIGYPPDDHDLQCETRDLDSVECRWRVGRPTHLSLKSPTHYQLLGSPCGPGAKERCSQTVHFGAEERNWTLKAQNKLGTVELLDRADLTKRVHMFAPDAVTASNINSRNASLMWRWTVEQYNNLNLTCQTHMSHVETNTTVENAGIGLTFVDLSDLIPHWTYSVKVRCTTAQNFWRWGDWSRSFTFQTQGDAPDAPDVWMQKKENQTLVIWKKLLANQSHGEITHYRVTWSRTGEEDQRVNVSSSTDNVTLSLNPSEEHIVTVTAINPHGSSPPSTIIVPSISPGSLVLSTSSVSGSGGGFSLSWPASPAASCGYTVDWRAASGTGSVDWLRIPPNHTSARVVSESFRDGRRYLLSVHACTDGAPELLQKNQGYVRETRMEDNLFQSVKCIEEGSDVEVSWDPVPQLELTAFIRGYALHYQDHNGSPRTVSTDDPQATSLMVRNLRKASYTFTVTAVTAVGECGNTSIIAVLSSQTDDLIWPVFITLGSVLVFLSITTVVCYRQWACITLKVYPPIPKPVLTEKFTSPTQYFATDQWLHTETDILDVPELLHGPGESLKVHMSPEDVHTQTLNNNDSLWTPAVATATPQKDFFNPSYSLMLPTEDEPGRGPEVLSDAGMMNDGYRPQSPAGNVSSDQTEEISQSCMSVISAYIPLPAPPPSSRQL